MAELLFNEFFCTYPFHIFAYLPFHSTLRISGRKILLVSVMAELLYLTVFALLVSAGLPAVYVQYTAIPVFGIFLYSLVKANVGIITFQYIFVIDYLMVIRACAFFVCQTFFHCGFFSWQSGLITFVLVLLTAWFMMKRLMEIIDNLTADGKSVILITHKLKEITASSDNCTIIRQGKYIQTVKVADVNENELAAMMVGRDVNFKVDKKDQEPGEVVLDIEDLHAKDYRGVEILKGFHLNVRRGEIVGLAGVDGNGQTEFIHALTGLDKSNGGTVTLCGKDISHASIRRRGECMSHIPEDRHKHGLVLDFTLEQNLVLQRYKEPEFEKGGFIKKDAVRAYAERLIEEYDIRSGQGPVTTARSMSGGNQQKAIIAREVDRNKPLIVAVQPTRGLDVGAIENVHKELVKQRDAGKAVLLVSLELDEVMSLSDRILVMYEGEVVGEFDPKQITVQELGLYMAGAKRADKKEGETA